MKKESDKNLENKKIFARNLSRHLEKTGTPQIALAKAIGVHPATVCDWVKERAYPRMDKVQRIATFFGISKAELVEDVFTSRERVSGQEQKLLDLFYSTPADYRDGLLELIEVYAKNIH